MAAFERELRASQACLGSGNGKYVRLHRVQASKRFRPFDIPIGPKPVDMADLASVLGRVADARGGKDVPPFTALEVFQLCQNAFHDYHPRTMRFSALLERVGGIVLTDAQPIRAPRNALQDIPSQFLNIKETTVSLKNIRPHSPVQVLSVAADEGFPAITDIVEAAISTPHNEAYVALQGLIGVRIATSAELQ